jgi:hypothetical protein
MRRWMHTCYTLVTSKESQTLILKSLSSLGLLHSLALQRCFSAEQMSKRPLKEVEGIYLYTSQTNPTVTCRISKTRTNRTRWSMWPDTPVKCNGRKPKVSADWPDASVRDDRTRRSGMTGRVRSCKNLTELWPDAWPRPIIDDRTRQVSLGSYWNVTGRVRSLHSRVWLCNYPLKHVSDWPPRTVLSRTASGRSVNYAVTC